MLTPIFGCQKTKLSVDRIAQKKSSTFVLEDDRIPEAVLVRIGIKQRPVRAAVRGLVQPRLVAGAAGHHNGRIRVPGPDAAKVQLLRSRRHSTALPHIPPSSVRRTVPFVPLAQATP